MGIVLKGTGVPAMEAGAYMARVVRIVDLGIQRQEYKGEVKPSKQELQFTFEFPTELIDIDGEKKPRWMSKNYKVSFHEKAGLTKLLKAIDPDGSKMEGSVEQLLNSPCQVSIENYKGNDNKIKAKVTDITQVMKGMEVAELYNDPKTFSIDDPDMDMWGDFPDWLKEKIRNAEDYSDSPLAELDTPVSSEED